MTFDIFFGSRAGFIVNKGNEHRTDKTKLNWPAEPLSRGGSTFVWWQLCSKPGGLELGLTSAPVTLRNKVQYTVALHGPKHKGMYPHMHWHWTYICVDYKGDRLFCPYKTISLPSNCVNILIWSNRSFRIQVYKIVLITPWPNLESVWIVLLFWLNLQEHRNTCGVTSQIKRVFFSEKVQSVLMTMAESLQQPRTLIHFTNVFILHIWRWIHLRHALQD